MDLFTLAFYAISIILFVIALIKDKEGARQAISKSKNMMKNMVGDIFGIIFLIGLLLVLIPPETIKTVLGSDNVFLSSFIAAVVGAITLIPAFVAFPLVGSFIDVGASIIPGVAFLTTLTMVGLVTLPLEKKAFGTKFALIRNGLSFLAALIIAGLMGVIL